MKKTILMLFLVLFLIGCNRNEVLNISFSKQPLTEYVQGTSKEEALKNIEIKVERKKKTEVLKGNDYGIMVSNFDLDTLGEYTMKIKYSDKELTWKYNVVAKPWDGTVDTSWYKENMEKFTIKNANELAGLSELVNKGNSFKGKTISLQQDINLNNYEWIPIGTAGKGVSNGEKGVFCGIFDGNNHLVKNLKIFAEHSKTGEPISTENSYYNCGLFGKISNATIKNVSLYNVTIQNGMMNNGVRAMQGTGALIGWISDESMVENIKIYGNINIRAEYKVGGVIGNISGNNINILNLEVQGEENSIIFGSDLEFKNTNNFGGIIGFSSATNLHINKCTSNITVSGYTSGGIIGCAASNDTIIENCYVNGMITDPEESICGGIMGARFANVTIKECYVLGTVSIGKLENNTYADVLVSKYGNDSVINASDNYFAEDKMSEKIFNSLNAIGKKYNEFNKNNAN